MYVTFPSCDSGQAAWSSAPLSQPSRGLGLYQGSNWITPFQLADDWRSLISARGRVPDGWGLAGLRRGLGCTSCGGGGCSHMAPATGLGSLSMDGSGLLGTGIFGTGVTLSDVSTWTWAEYAAVGVAVWFGLSLVSSLGRQASGVRRGVSGIGAARKSARSRRAKRKKLESEIEAL